MKDSISVKLVIGLGNPGPSYALNRHNAGFMAVDALAHFYAFNPFKRHGQSLIAEGTVDQKRVILLKPLTYMNLSGQGAAEVAGFFKISCDRILVIHDDLDIPFSKIRFKQGGGHGGHNGLKSLDSTLGRDYRRLRIGIGHPGPQEPVSAYVLSNFSKAEQEELVFLLRHVVEAFPLFLQGNIEEAKKAVPAEFWA